MQAFDRSFDAEPDPFWAVGGVVPDLLESLPDAMLVVDEGGIICWANEQSVTMFGHARALMVGRSMDMLVPLDDTAGHAEFRSDYFASPGPRPLGSGLTLTAVRSDGTEFPVDISLSTIERDGVTLAIAAVRDLSESTAYRAEQRMSLILDHSNDAIVGETLEGIITSWNLAAEQLYGYSATEALGRPSSMLTPRRPLDDTTLLDRLTRGELVEHFETSQVDRADRRLDVSLSATLTRDSQGALVGVTTIAQDISARNEAERSIRDLHIDLELRRSELQHLTEELTRAHREMTHQTLHDPLTGLPNRVLFLRRLAAALEHAQRTGFSSTVYLVDLDGFKRVNNLHGIAAGDELLRTVAARLLAAVRPQDTVARVSGDELAVLTLGAPDDGPTAERADRLLGAVLDPPLRSRGSTVTASIGLAVSRAGDRPEHLLGDADAAMYRAKRDGGGRWAAYGPDLHEERRSRSVTEEQLRDALANDGIRVFYQPLVGLDDGRVIGAEALVRLRIADGRLLVPDEFLETAEVTGLVLPLGLRVLEHACQQPVRWHGESGSELFVAVNLSPRELGETHIVTAVASALTASGLSGDRLRLELSESALLDGGPSVRDTLTELRSMGVLVGVEDLGTDDAVISYVSHLPLDFIKIDRALVAGMEMNPRDRALVESTLVLSDRLGLRSVAEGIETKAQWDRLRDLGCTEGQGFLFSRPVRSALVGSRNLS